MGMLLTHRLIKRHANKERLPIPEYLLKRSDTERTRLREVIYYYLDYREFANVVKYRIAMMRKGIDEKVMNVGYCLVAFNLAKTSWTRDDVADLLGCGTQRIHLSNMSSPLYPTSDPHSLLTDA